MIIRKQLQNATFVYDFDKKWLMISPNAFFTRSQMFSLMRFCIRIAQKGKPRNMIKNKLWKEVNNK